MIISSETPVLSPGLIHTSLTKDRGFESELRERGENSESSRIVDNRNAFFPRNIVIYEQGQLRGVTRSSRWPVDTRHSNHDKLTWRGPCKVNGNSALPPRDRLSSCRPRELILPVGRNVSLFPPFPSVRFSRPRPRRRVRVSEE